MQPMTKKKNTPPQANARRPVHRPSHPHSNRAGASAGSPPNASTATLLPRPLGPPPPPSIPLPGAYTPTLSAEAATTAAAETVTATFFEQ
uniref:Uncharacterized protein n=1 Tax=Human herpesvirus 6B TaxID=32604 RepID=A0A2L2QDV0_HHV6H|nr:hypothetical protein [Human betaherpesvirus 6B]